MTTCPHCGRVADELVCADCGMSLALVRRAADLEAARAAAAARAAGIGASTSPDLLDDLASEDADSDREPKAWRLPALVGVTCLLALATAIVLLQQHGSPPSDDLGLPVTSSPAGTGVSTPGVPSGPSRASGISDGPSRPSGVPTSPGTPSATKSKPSASQAAHRSSSAPTTPRTTTRPPAPTGSAHLTKGALDDQCGPHCYRLIVTLSGFASGTHQVACWSSHGGMFASYRTSSATSSDCSLQKPNASVWVVVDGRSRSNTVAW